MVSSSSNDSDSSSFSKPLKKKCKVLPDTNSESSQPSGSDSEDYLGITNSHRKKQIISSGPESFSEGESSHKNPAMVAEANSSDDDGDKCIICFKTLRPPFAHPSNCEHNFHPVCLSTWSKTSNTCPIDRVQYTAVVVVDHNGRLVSREGVTTPPPQNHNADFELDDATFCEVCSQHDREHELLLCDRCEAGYHLNCLDPPLSSIPEGNWFCPHCAEIHDELSEEMQSLLDDAAVLLTPRFRPRAPVTRTSRGPRTRGAQRVFNIIHHQETIGQPSTSTSSVTIQRRQMTSRRSSGRSRGSRCPRSARYKVELITVEDGTTLEVKVAVNTRSRTKSKKRLKKSSKKKCSKSSCKNEPSSRSCDQSMCSSQGPSQSLDLFGSRPQLDYFSGCEAEDELDEDGGGGLAVLRSAARPNVRSMANRKQCAAQILNTSQRRVTPRINVSRAPVDLVSSIIEQQEKWHNPNAIYHTDGYVLHFHGQVGRRKLVKSDLIDSNKTIQVQMNFVGLAQRNNT
ncbi:Hypothetical protein NTJ_05618 [Nesidiocoris tenuis]|uniref:PHD and RING finger domain-containing protein 1 n=1 Tax=Nesidiocoris tenuis TaxID=355587 RepID=A0ABN7AKR4_9HEMI|nr:Hypothetical protein NTJ_05618 [Nesidiocoris tenuis]